MKVDTKRNMTWNLARRHKIGVVLAIVFISSSFINLDSIHLQDGQGLDQ